MARVFPKNIEQRPEGTLLIEEYHEGYNEIYFVPPAAMLKQAKLDHKQPESHKVRILDVNITQNYIEIFPINTLGRNSRFLESKYSKLKSIVLEEFVFEFPENEEEVVYLLEELPSGFVKDYDYGLGFIKELNPLVSSLEKFGVEHLVIKDENLKKAEIDTANKTCVMSYAQFNKTRKELAKVVRNSRKASLLVRGFVANNFLSYFLDDENYPMKTLKIQNDSLSKLVAKDSENIEMDLSRADQKLMMSLVKKNAKKIAKEQPEKLLKLRDDIELVTLEQLINKYEEMLGKRLSETRWQELLNENPFILSMAFGCPVLKIQDHASVGGIRFSGLGNKITEIAFLRHHPICQVQ